MKDVKFRAKTINGEWVYGYYYFCKKRTRGIIVTVKDTEQIEVEVDIETVGQYIGLSDLVGTEIYEDDKLQRYDVDGPSGSGEPLEGVATVKYYTHKGYRFDGVDAVRGRLSGSYIGTFDGQCFDESDNVGSILYRYQAMVCGNIHD